MSEVITTCVECGQVTKMLDEHLFPENLECTCEVEGLEK